MALTLRPQLLTPQLSVVTPPEPGLLDSISKKFSHSHLFGMLCARPGPDSPEPIGHQQGGGRPETVSMRPVVA